jgi:Tol biopolymer transport system component
MYLGSLDSTETTRLAADDSTAVSAPDGRVLWIRAGRLVAQRLDLTRRALTGEQVTLADSVDDVSVATSGVVAYRAAGTTTRQLRWFDRTGKDLGALGASADASALLGSLRLSPNGRRAAVRLMVQGNEDLWLLDGTRTSRFTFDPANERNPTWSPDGSRVVFSSDRTGVQNLYLKPSSSAASEVLLLDSPYAKVPSDWSADGRFLLYHSPDPQTDQDLWVLPLEGDRKPWLFLKTNFNERHAHFSPDGRWVVYMSNESGRAEIYARPFAFPAGGATASGSATDTVQGRTGGQWQVSTAGGIFPQWARDGRELYYIGPEGHLMAVPITITGETIEPGASVTLFETRIAAGGEDVGQGPQYDVARDGRFLINTVRDVAAPPITILQNWAPQAAR